MQEKKKCDPAGRSCIESYANHHFNCSVACEGIFVDVEWEEDHVLTSSAETTNKMDVERKGDVLKIGKVEKLINDYVAFKRAYVQHFRYDAKATSSNFSKFFTHKSYMDFLYINHFLNQVLRCPSKPT